MRKALVVLSLFALLISSGCALQEQNDKITSLEAAVKQLKAEVSELKQKPTEHHYELRNQGMRTFRFDPATGETCIQLTSQADWKNKDTKSDSCSCADNAQKYIEMPMGTDQERQSAQHYFDTFVKAACGS